MKERLTLTDVKLILFNTLGYTLMVYNAGSVIAFTSPYLISSILFNSFPFSLIGIYGSIVISYFTRIIGSAILGPIADKVGRKKAMVVGGIGSSISTFLISLIPPYDSAGLLSPILFFSLIGLQGFFSGPLSAGIQVIGIENLPEKHRGWFSGIGFVVGGTSLLYATSLSYLVSSLIGNYNYEVYGWRFLYAGSLLVIPVCYLSPDSARFKNYRRKVSKPVKLVFLKYRKNLIFALLLSFLWASLNFSVIVIMPNFLYSVNGLRETSLNEATAIYSITSSLSAFLGGAISEVLGRRKVSIIGSILSFISSPLYIFLGNTMNFEQISLYLTGITTLTFFGAGGILALVNESFPTEVRGTGVSLSWNTGFFLGTIVPLISSILISKYGVNYFPEIQAIIVFSLSLTALLTSLLSEETKGRIEKEEQV